LVAKLVEEARAEILDLQFEEVDITEHPETAVKYRVMATPAIAISGRLVFTGEADFRRAILESRSSGS